MERGFIRTKLELKCLLLYLLSRLTSPVDLATLTDLSLCDNAVSYFDFTQALSELVDTGHATLTDGLYTVTEKGKKNGAATENDIPYSVRIKSDRHLAEVNARLLRESRIHSSVTAQPSGSYLVRLALDDDDGPLFSLFLRVQRQEDCGGLIARFRADPEGFFQTLHQFVID